MNLLQKNTQLTKYPIPVISIVVFIVSLILKFIELGYKYNDSISTYPDIVKWFFIYKLGFLTPFMDLLGITQFSKPELSFHPIVIVIMVLGTLILMSITEIFYGRLALILLLLIGTMTIPYIADLKFYSCFISRRYSTFCCGSALLYILLASVINIIFTNKSLVLGGVLHILVIIALIVSDYYTTFKKTSKSVKLCASITHHASIYIIGFIMSLGLLVISSKSPLIL